MSEFVIRIEGIGDGERIAQLEEIVRCKDCGHSFKDGTLCRMFAEFAMCEETIPIEVEPDGFCKWGVRRDDAGARVEVEVTA